eukprot:NODE_629_length_1900_cov_9.721772_g505_i0.p1 GENE.NODE_629_length_1900_cov_9.721772_g505_i0~~NODE_629_length_1900_cov_9.721772_g505_i0.p1  ORF type:complete len:600 (-),score=197.65 NODE_629_length_1900_cov_9.721772_g505_i0:100-1899(-)
MYGSGFLKAHFKVVKYNPNAKSFFSSPQSRVWVTDFFKKNFDSFEDDGKPAKTHSTTKLLQLEKNIMDSTRLRMMFFDANHSYEMVFKNGEQRSRFYECAQSMRPAIRVFCPALVKEGEETCAVSITGKTAANTDSEQKPDGKTEEIGDENAPAKINATKKPFERCSIWCGTWDLCGKAPPKGEDRENLEFWMPREKYDLYVVAAQGVSYRKKEDDFYKYIMQYLGKNYISLASLTLFDTCMIVLIKKKHLLKVTNVEGNTRPTQMEATAGKTGGAAISVKYHETSMCFLNMSLPPKKEKVKLRHKIFHEVLSELRLADKESDISHQFDHLFVLGNLNYRVDTDRATAMQLIEAEDFDPLLEHDQLTKVLNAGRQLFGFREADEICFKPTWKMVPGSDQYVPDEKLVPSYTDRIIVKSQNDAHLVTEIYAGAEEVTHTEHTPVFATFILQARRPFASIFQPLDTPEFRVRLFSVEIQDSMQQALERPQLVVKTQFSEYPSMSRPLKTKTPNPIWKGEELPTLIVHTHHKDFINLLNSSFIVRDYAQKDPVSAFYGLAVCPMEPFTDFQKHLIELPLVAGGKQIGRMIITMKLVPLKKKD